jgi:hypothetical protein
MGKETSDTDIEIDVEPDDVPEGEASRAPFCTRSTARRPLPPS